MAAKPIDRTVYRWLLACSVGIVLGQSVYWLHSHPFEKWELFQVVVVNMGFIGCFFVLLPVLLITVVFSVLGLIRGTWQLRRRLAVWYVCMVLGFLFGELLPERLQDGVLLLLVLLAAALPIVWLKGSRPAKAGALAPPPAQPS